MITNWKSVNRKNTRISLHSLLTTGNWFPANKLRESIMYLLRQHSHIVQRFLTPKDQKLFLKLFSFWNNGVKTKSCVTVPHSAPGSYGALHLVYQTDLPELSSTSTSGSPRGSTTDAPHWWVPGSQSEWQLMLSWELTLLWKSDIPQLTWTRNKRRGQMTSW